MQLSSCVHKNRSSIARQRIIKHTSFTIEAVSSAWPLQSDCTEVFSCIKGSEKSSFGAPACWDMSLGAEEMNSVECSELAAAE
jgi:hypothetical protein